MVGRLLWNPTRRFKDHSYSSPCPDCNDDSFSNCSEVEIDREQEKGIGPEMDRQMRPVGMKSAFGALKAIRKSIYNKSIDGSRESAIQATLAELASREGETQWSSVKDDVEKHFRSLSLLYAKYGFNSRQVSRHMSLLHQAASLKPGVPVAHIEVRDSDASDASDQAMEDSNSDSSRSSLSLSTFSIDDLSSAAVSPVDITFACSSHLCRHSVGSTFQKAGLKVVSLLTFDTVGGLTLGVLTLHVALGDFSERQVIELLESAGQAPKRKSYSGSPRDSSPASGTSSGSSSGRKAPMPDLGSALAARLSPFHIKRINSRGISEASNQSMNADGEGDDTLGEMMDRGHGGDARGLLQVLLSEQGTMREQLGRWMLDASKLELGSVIAVGASGEVRRGRYDGQDVAVKILKGEGKETRTTMAEFRREVLTLMSCGQSEHLLKFHGICIDMRQRMCIVTQFMEGGTAYDLLRRKNAGLPLREVVRIAKEVAMGMQYLHQHGVIHRDLKTANILIDGKGSVVVGDFGVARLKGERGEMTKEVGTYRWMAPEAFGTGEWTVTHKSDVYSFGIVLWELLTGKLPYADYSPLQAAVAVALNGLRPEIPTTCPDSLRLLIERCWDKTPKERPEFSQIVAALEAISLEFAAAC